MKKAISMVLTAGILSYAATVSVFCAVTGRLNHDEHQFMAGAYMVARHGLQPYRDFAYFHMPNLVYLYFPFFFTPNPFLAARLFSALCAFGLCLTVFLISLSLFRPLGAPITTVIAAAGTVLLPNTVLFQYASSKVWNHSSAMLCAVLAFSLHSKAIGEGRFAFFVLSGFALGMACGIRLTFAPLIAPFLLAILLSGSASWRNKAWSVLAFTIGAVVANLPAIYFCLISYRDFMFSTLGYRKLNLLYLKDTSHSTAMSFSGKVQHLMDSFRGDSVNLIVPIVAFLGVIILSIAMIRRFAKPRFEVAFLIGLLPFLLLGCFAPTPAYYQYWFALIPFLLLLGLYALSSVGSPKLLLAGGALVVIAAVISFYDGGQFGENIAVLHRFFRPYWVPLRLEQDSQWIRQQLAARGQGKVLTLSPLYAIEAGLPIYKEFVTGPFAWRVSYLLPADEAAARKVPWAPAIEVLLRKEPPLAVLTGRETRKLEAPIIRVITLLGYAPTRGPGGVVLWTLPE